jgi:hypothetical protein
VWAQSEDSGSRPAKRNSMGVEYSDFRSHFVNFDAANAPVAAGVQYSGVSGEGSHRLKRPTRFDLDDDTAPAPLLSVLQ